MLRKVLKIMSESGAGFHARDQGLICEEVPADARGGGVGVGAAGCGRREKSFEKVGFRCGGGVATGAVRTARCALGLTLPLRVGFRFHIRIRARIRHVCALALSEPC